MFIESKHDGHWNLELCANYRRDKKGVFHLVFPVPGGNFDLAPDHPQYRQAVQYLVSRTLPHDRPEDAAIPAL